MSRRRTGRVVVGAVALAAMVALGWRVGAPGRTRGPAVVESVSTWRVTSFGDGRYRWVVEDGRSPLGPAVVAEGVVQGERADPMELVLADGIVADAHVDEGQLVASLRSPFATGLLDATTAERDEIAAKQALLEAGGRSETVEAARQQVAVATAALQEARREAARLAELASAGAVPGWQAEEAALRVSVREAERDLAEARLEESRRPPRAEEVEAVVAQLAAAQARLDAATTRVGLQQLSAPFAGTVRLPGDGVAVEVHADGPSLVRIAVPEDDRAGVAPGAAIGFTLTAEPDTVIPGRVVAVADAARPLGGRTVVWAVAELEGPAPAGATGTATIERSAR